MRASNAIRWIYVANCLKEHYREFQSIYCIRYSTVQSSVAKPEPHHLVGAGTAPAPPPTAPPPTMVFIMVRNLK
jgi:hypothetical protein